MRKIYLILVSIFIISCVGTHAPVEKESKKTKITIQTEAPKKEVAQSKSEDLVGKQHREALQQEPFNNWFTPNYNEYSLDTKTAEKLSLYLKDISIKVFMGTWCGDSKRETPTFYKILDHIGYDYKNLELITVTRKKDTPRKYEKGLNIARVPTFIFYKDGKELGRYVEFARETLEKDILAIVSGKPYKHSYQD